MGEERELDDEEVGTESEGTGNPAANGGCCAVRGTLIEDAIDGSCSSTEGEAAA